MRTQRRGSIVTVTSIGSLLGFPNNPGYVASKGGLRMMSKALALDLGKFNVRVNNLVPGYVHTDMTTASYSDPLKSKERAERTMLGRWGQVGDLIGAAIYLASDASSYVTGTDLVVDGGWTAKGL
jgi:NAD(P)-dependent dehydrogenase (short-subunit alcohol dehydrogenase family)